MDYIIGVDPGKHGAIAFISRDKSKIWAKPFHHLTETDIARVFEDAKWAQSHVFLEQVHSMPKQGVASSFTFGQQYGFVRGVLVGLGVPFDLVPPQVWQRALGAKSNGASKTDHKRNLKGIAQRLFPGVPVVNDTADALLIAEYGYRHLLIKEQN